MDVTHFVDAGVPWMWRVWCVISSCTAACKARPSEKYRWSVSMTWMRRRSWRPRLCSWSRWYHLHPVLLHILPLLLRLLPCRGVLTDQSWLQCVSGSIPRTQYIGDGVLFSIDLFVSLFVYIFLCFFVSKITRKRLDRFAWNFQQRCGVTVGWPDSILGQIRETARCCDTNFFYIICQHYEQTAGPMCMKLLGKVWTVEWPWDDVIQFLVSSEKPRDAAMRNMGMGFVVLLHHSLLFSVVVCLTGMFSVKKYRLGYVLKDL